MSKITTNHNLYAQIAQLLQAAKQNVVRAVNQTMVYTYYEIGRMIVEDEQQGKERAEYGKQILEDLAIRLTHEFGKGFSVVNLRQMRAFYLTYSIQQTTSAELKLSWSHYLKLIRIQNPKSVVFMKLNVPPTTGV
jgi:predicted GNAT family N-acyltransferase